MRRFVATCGTCGCSWTMTTDGPLPLPTDDDGTFEFECPIPWCGWVTAREVVDNDPSTQLGSTSTEDEGTDA